MPSIDFSDDYNDSADYDLDSADKDNTNIKKYTISDILKVARDTINSAIDEFQLDVIVADVKEYKTMIFLVLKDVSASNINAVIYKSRYVTKLIVDDKIMINTKAEIYNCKLQLNILSYNKIGTEEHDKNLNLLKAKFASMGYFDNKPKLVDNYDVIGVISSFNAAGLKDFIYTLNARCIGKKIYVYEASMQGKSAPAQIISAIELANNHKMVGILVMVRGGGATEDLECFNDEAVAKSIYRSKIPIVTGIGHQINTCLADLVCAKTFITPTSAGQNITIENKNNKKIALDLLSKFGRKIHNYLTNYYDYLLQVKNTLDTQYEIVLDQLNEYITNTQTGLSNATDNYGQIIQTYTIELKNSSNPQIIDKKMEITSVNDLVKGKTYKIKFIDGVCDFTLI